MKTWQSEFEGLVGKVRAVLISQLRKRNRLYGATLDDLVSDGLYHAMQGYRSAYERGIACNVTVGTLARYALAAISSGRAGEDHLNSRETLSRYAQLRVGSEREELRDILSGERANPYELAQAKIDVGAWIERLPYMARTLAKCALDGLDNATIAIALGVSTSRVSQLRRGLVESYLAENS